MKASAFSVLSLVVSFGALGGVLAAPPTPLVCPGAPAPQHPLVPSSGWRATTALGGLTMPRGIVIDTLGNLLVVERGKGVTGHRLNAQGCVISSKVVIADTSLNHGIDVNVLGNRLVASSASTAWSWNYNPLTMTVSNKKTLVTNMYNAVEMTRTLLFSRNYPYHLMISVGSDDDVDLQAFLPAVGRAEIRVFNTLTLPSGGASFASSYGKLMGYGLRNDVGIAEDTVGNLHSVENSIDDAYVMIDGTRHDVHANNPADKIYKLGHLMQPQGVFGGYPYCFTVWDATPFVNEQPGNWFLQTPNTTLTEAWCDANAHKPTVLLEPHTAPLDMKFGKGSDDSVYLSMHGSFNSPTPVGYSVISIPGRNTWQGWSPSAPLAQTKNISKKILVNANPASCTPSANCFRPVGLSFSANGRNLYVSSDTTGEVFLVKKN